MHQKSSVSGVQILDRQTVWVGLVQSVQVKYQFLMRDFVCLRLKTFESPPKFLVEFVCEQVDTSMILFVALLVTRAPPSGNHKLQPLKIFLKFF